MTPARLTPPLCRQACVRGCNSNPEQRLTFHLQERGVRIEPLAGLSARLARYSYLEQPDLQRKLECSTLANATQHLTLTSSAPGDAISYESPRWVPLPVRNWLAGLAEPAGFHSGSCGTATSRLCASKPM